MGENRKAVGGRRILERPAWRLGALLIVIVLAHQLLADGLFPDAGGTPGTGPLGLGGSPAHGSLVFSTLVGGTDEDEIAAIAVDASGSTYLAGYTRRSYYPDPYLWESFPTTLDAYQRDYGGDFSDGFVAKLNPDGTALLFSTLLGGNGQDYISSMAIDPEGNVYVAGHSNSTDFPATPGTLQGSRFGYFNFLVKFDSEGSRILYSASLPGAEISKIAVDGSGNLFATGTATTLEFPTTPSALDTTLGGNSDAFVAKLNAGATALEFSTLLGGSGRDAAGGIALDRSGSIHIMGDTASTDFPTTPGAQQSTYRGHQDAFIATLSPDGRNLSYSTFLGGSSFDHAAAMALDAQGSVYVSGATNSSDFPTTPGSFDTSLNGKTRDVFVAKFDAQGKLAYSTFLGGSDDREWGEWATALALDGAGSAFAVGSTSSRDFPTTPGSLDPTFEGPYVGRRGFISKLDPSGASLSYSSFLGKGELDIPLSAAVDDAGLAYVGGKTSSVDFPVTTDLTQRRGSDGFITKLDTGLQVQGSPNLIPGAWTPWLLLAGLAGTGSLVAWSLDRRARHQSPSHGGLDQGKPPPGGDSGKNEGLP